MVLMFVNLIPVLVTWYHPQDITGHFSSKSNKSAWKMYHFRGEPEGMYDLSKYIYFPTTIWIFVNRDFDVLSIIKVLTLLQFRGPTVLQRVQPDTSSNSLHRVTFSEKIEG